MIDFAKLEFDDATTQNLFKFCKTHRLGLADVPDQSHLRPSEFKFHITVMYSKVTSPLFPQGERPFAPHVVQPESFDLFGPDNDLLVLRLKLDPILASLFDHYRETYGHVSDFRPFRPHVTLKGSSDGVRGRLESIPLPDFELRASRLIHKLKTSS